MLKKFFIVFLLFAISCDTSDMHELEGLKILKYSPTQCAEKWQFGQNDTETISNIDKYLKQNGIAVSEITISKSDGGIYCAACTCPSGRVITIKADTTNAEKLVKIGFAKI